MSASSYTGPAWRDPHPQLCNHGVGARCISLRLATRLIDQLAYDGYDVRSLLHTDGDESSVDLGCGVGFSTSAGGVGVDASREMLQVARARRPDATFVRGLAERWGRDGDFARATCAFLLHEQPRERRRRILKNAYRICSRELLVMDIHPTYTPSFMMKTGEPYVEDYLRHIEADVAAFDRVLVTSHCDDRVVLYTQSKGS